MTSRFGHPTRNLYRFYCQALLVAAVAAGCIARRSLLLRRAGAAQKPPIISSEAFGSHLYPCPTWNGASGLLFIAVAFLCAGVAASARTIAAGGRLPQPMVPAYHFCLSQPPGRCGAALFGLLGGWVCSVTSWVVLYSFSITSAPLRGPRSLAQPLVPGQLVLALVGVVTICRSGILGSLWTLWQQSAR